MNAVIFANGELNKTSVVDDVLKASGLIIAADGGARHCLDLGITPQVVIGDLDSLSASDLEDLKNQGSSIIRHPSRKDHTDLELALLYALQSEAEEIIVLGALGKRWDQTLANLLLPAGEEFSQTTIRLVDGHQEINLIRPGKTLEIRGRAGDIVSLIPLWGDADGITTRGLEYPLENGSLKFASTRGISNVLLEQKAQVKLNQGLLICVLIHLDQPGEC
jgi:thiamine pyrophosphokinase